MKAYLIISGTVFGLVTVAHIARVFAEGTHLIKEPLFVVLTLLTTALCVWAWRLATRSSP